MAHSYDVVGYAYDADTYCVSCASKRFTQDDLDNLSSKHLDEWGGTLDSDPTPLFEGDEGSDEYYCWDCFGKLI